MTIDHLTDETFADRIETASRPILVEFGAEWCAPCRQLEPVLRDFAEDNAARLGVATIDVDESPLAPSKFGVRGIPTLMVFRDGAPIATTVGAMWAGPHAPWIEDSL